jgi:hypothetical protein
MRIAGTIWPSKYLRCRTLPTMSLVALRMCSFSTVRHGTRHRLHRFFLSQAGGGEGESRETRLACTPSGGRAGRFTCFINAGRLRVSPGTSNQGAVARYQVGPAQASCLGVLLLSSLPPSRLADFCFPCATESPRRSTRDAGGGGPAHPPETAPFRQVGAAKQQFCAEPTHAMPTCLGSRWHTIHELQLKRPHARSPAGLGDGSQSSRATV